MGLDFTGLFAGQEPPADSKPPELHSIGLDRLQQERQAILDTYRRQQDAIKRSNSLETEILKGLQAGEPIPSLFLKAIECIGLITGNTVLKTMAERDITAVYGIGLQQPEALKLELDAVQQRLKKLHEAADRSGTQPDEKARIVSAIRAHTERAQMLQGLIDRAGA